MTSCLKPGITMGTGELCLVVIRITKKDLYIRINPLAMSVRGFEPRTT